MDPTLLPRIDSERFLSAFSAVIDGKREQAPSWKLGPGWSGEDVRIGKDYTKLLGDSFSVSTTARLAEQSRDDLMRLWNSDNYTTDDAYNKPELTQLRDRWAAHVDSMMECIPLCVTAGNIGKVPTGQKFSPGRRGLIQVARNRIKKAGGSGEKNARKRTRPDTPASEEEPAEVEAEAVESEDEGDEEHEHAVEKALEKRPAKRQKRQLKKRGGKKSDRMVAEPGEFLERRSWKWL
jgi:hypothetical protein